MSVLAASPDRVLHKPRRVDGRALLGILLMILATVGSVLFWTTTSDTRAVVVSTRDLPAGSTISPADLAVARVRVDDSIYAAAIPESELNNLVGRQLDQPAFAHQILVRVQVSTHSRLGPNQVALTIPISPENAAGGTLRPNDQVDVLVTTNPDKPDARTTIVLSRVSVYDVGHASTVGAINVDSSNASSSSVRWVTLAVTPDQAVRLANARWSGQLDVALLPPSSGGARG